ncbi:MAG: hypothetical protein JWL96_755 [Sphingomonas bacterium]|nr:hypothetical protein [Sphingomonas bacterium]
MMNAAPAPIRIGCSGWVYPHWRGRFYPEKLAAKNWFAFYAEHFDTVEINNSFYRLPKAETFDAWRAQAPDGFCYAVKANRFLTQAKKLKDCEEPLERMMAPFRHLQLALGAILYQLPPRFRLNLDRLESFLDLIPKDVTNVFEFRDKSWFVDEVFALLDRHGAGFCAHDMPGLETPRIATGNAAYVRFHGGEGKYWGRYPDERLLGWADWMLGQSRQGRTVWAFFNNDVDAQAIHDALTLKAMIAQSIGVAR